MYKKNKGITLIALVITIIVMLILVAVTISMAVNGGLFDYAGKAVGDTQNAIDAEKVLSNGKIQVDGIWYDSIDDYIKGIQSEDQSGETTGGEENNEGTNEGTTGGETEEDIEKETITFTVYGKSYTAEAGMTWEEFYKDEKYSLGEFISNYDSVNGTGCNDLFWIGYDGADTVTNKTDCYKYCNSFLNVDLTTEIVANTNYKYGLASFSVTSDTGIVNRFYCESIECGASWSSFLVSDYNINKVDNSLYWEYDRESWCGGYKVFLRLHEFPEHVYQASDFQVGILTDYQGTYTGNFDCDSSDIISCGN